MQKIELKTEKGRQFYLITSYYFRPRKLKLKKT